MMHRVTHQTQFEDAHITVSVGWDEDLERFFMSIADGWGAASELLYTNLYSPAQPHERYSLEGFRAILRKIGIEVPDAIFRQVEQLRLSKRRRFKR